jgi:DNA-binding transcriptional regulator PaaX
MHDAHFGRRRNQGRLDPARRDRVKAQQLAILRMKNLVDTRKEGNVIFYRLRDRRVNKLLEVARQIFEAHVIQLQSIAGEQKGTVRTAARPR